MFHNNKIKAKLYHWSDAEPISYKNLKKKKAKPYDDNNIVFYDLYKVFLNEPIIIKGELNFSL